MSGDSTGRDPAPESTDNAMNTSGLPGSTSKSLRLIYYMSRVNTVVDVVPSIDESPEQGRDTDATEIQDASAVAPSDPASSSAEPAASAPAAAEAANAPKKRHLLIPIPSRRSSKVNKQSASEKTEEAQDQPRRGSKVSIMRKRDHSRASSRRSRQTQDGANVESKETAATPETSPSKPQKKGPSKLLAFLGCCSSSDVDNDDAALPAKKTTMRPAASNRLPTPDKAEAHTGDSSTVESREPYLDEKANSTVSADQPGEEEGNVQAIAGGVHEGPSTGAVQPEASAQKDQREDIPAPAETGHVNGSVPESKANEPIRDLDGQTNVATEDSIAAPTSTVPKSTLPTKSFGVDGSEDVANPEDEAQQPAMVLPPPPPAPPAPPARGYPKDVPNPLLPVALPHLSGRKCLVLDLDETLVHSSFKVCTLFNMPDNGVSLYHHTHL